MLGTKRAPCWRLPGSRRSESSSIASRELFSTRTGTRKSALLKEWKISDFGQRRPGKTIKRQEVFRFQCARGRPRVRRAPTVQSTDFSFFFSFFPLFVAGRFKSRARAHLVLFSPVTKRDCFSGRARVSFVVFSFFLFSPLPSFGRRPTERQSARHSLSSHMNMEICQWCCSNHAQLPADDENLSTPTSTDRRVTHCLAVHTQVYQNSRHASCSRPALVAGSEFQRYSSERM